MNTFEKWHNTTQEGNVSDDYIKAYPYRFAKIAYNAGLEEAKQKWIKASNKLPKEGVMVLVRSKNWAKPYVMEYEINSDIYGMEWLEIPR